MKLKPIFATTSEGNMRQFRVVYHSTKEPHQRKHRCRYKNSSETRMSVKSNTYAHMHCKYLKPKYSQLSVLPSLSLWKTWHVYTLYSGYLLGIPPSKGLLGGLKQLGYHPRVPAFSLWISCVCFLCIYMILYLILYLILYISNTCIYIYMKHYTLYTTYHIFLKMVYIYIHTSVAKNTVLYTNTKAT